jgi:hypothetical protein
MRVPRTALVVLAVMLAVPLAQAAPVPEPGREAKERLEALKKRMPGVLDAWMKAYPYEGRDRGVTWTAVFVLRRVRLVSGAEAKLTFHARKAGAAVAAAPEHILTVFLKYHDGLWTTVSYQWSDRGRMQRWEGIDFLLDAIDEAAEKK